MQLLLEHLSMAFEAKLHALHMLTSYPPTKTHAAELETSPQHKPEVHVRQCCRVHVGTSVCLPELA